MLFPGGVLPLHIFEERYRLLVQEGQDFGVVLIRQGREVGEEPELYEVGTMATLQLVQPLADGRYNIVVRGTSRFRIQSLERSRPYLMADAELLPEPPATASGHLLSLLDTYLRELSLRILAGHDVTPQRALWLAGSVLQAEPAKLQELLSSARPALAEEMLRQELERRRILGQLATFQPTRGTSN